MTRSWIRGPWWRAAREAAEERYDYSPYLPKVLDDSARDLLWEHLYTFVSLLFAEIIGGGRSTYLREQLAWYAAGRFPCGRSADGKLRVF